VLTQERVTELFKEYLPAHVTITFQDVAAYIEDAMRHPFVQFQVSIGIYDLDSLHEDFLGAAKAIVPLDEVVVCLDLINNHVGQLSTQLQEGYVRHVAAHEAHHFEHGHGAASNLLEQATHTERECNDLIEQRYPELARLNDQVEQESVSIQRVYERVRRIREVTHV
jgi:hypothetical protein